MAVKSRGQTEKGAQDRIVITGIGVASSLGCSVWGTVLALRNRKSSWCEHETVLVADDPYGIVLRGATISRVPEEAIPPELDGAKRAIALLAPAVRECLGGLCPAEIELLDFQVDNLIAFDRHEFFPRLREAFPKLRLPREQEEADPVAELGNCAFFERIIRAAEKLRVGNGQRAIIGCVDSLCATSWLMAVRDEGVLKDSLTPEGIIAGEATGVLLLADALGRFAFHPRFRGSIALSASDESGARRIVCLERGDLPDRRALMEQVRKQVKVGKGNE